MLKKNILIFAYKLFSLHIIEKAVIQRIFLTVYMLFVKIQLAIRFQMLVGLETEGGPEGPPFSIIILGST